MFGILSDTRVPPSHPQPTLSSWRPPWGCGVQLPWSLNLTVQHASHSALVNKIPKYSLLNILSPQHPGWVLTTLSRATGGARTPLPVTACGTFLVGEATWPRKPAVQTDRGWVGLAVCMLWSLMGKDHRKREDQRREGKSTHILIAAYQRYCDVYI